MNLSSIRLITKYARPWSLAAGALAYFLGGGIAKYLGYAIVWDRFWAGLILVLLLLLASYTLKIYFDVVDAAHPLRRMQKDVEDEDLSVFSRLPRLSVLLAAFTILTAGAVITVVMIAEGAIQYATQLLLGVALFLAFFYGVPPLRFAYRGFGELSEAVLITGIFPALAFLIQTNDLHRMIPMMAFPLLALYLAMRLAQSLEHYGRDLKLTRRTMMNILGWQRGIQLHNILVLGAYLLLGLAAAFGLPWPLAWPGLLTLVIGIFQIYQMNQISTGARPGWRLLHLTSAASFAVTAYLLTLAGWTG